MNNYWKPTDSKRSYSCFSSYLNLCLKIIPVCRIKYICLIVETIVTSKCQSLTNESRKKLKYFVHEMIMTIKESLAESICRLRSSCSTAPDCPTQPLTAWKSKVLIATALSQSASIFFRRSFDFATVFFGYHFIFPYFVCKTLIYYLHIW